METDCILSFVNVLLIGDRGFEMQIGIDSADDIVCSVEFVLMESRSSHKRLPDENEGSDACAAMQREKCRHVGGRAIDIGKDVDL